MSDPIDIEHLDRYICGDTALMDEILTIFVEQANGWLAKLDPELSDDDWYHACHALKGASRGVGAWSVGNFAEDGENLIGMFDDKESVRRELVGNLQRSTKIAAEYAVRLRDSRSAA